MSRPRILRYSIIVLSLVFYSVVCTAQSPGNYGGEARPWITLDAAYSRFAEQSQWTFSAGLTSPLALGWSARGFTLRSISLLQGTVGGRVGSGTSGQMPWRFTLLDVDRELDPENLFDWSPCGKSTVLDPTNRLFSWHVGATLLDLDRTTAAENETRWIQARGGLVQWIRAWPLKLRTHVAVGAATIRLGDAEYSSLGKRAGETMTGGDLRFAAAADIGLTREYEYFIDGSIDAEARMLPPGLDTRRGTVGAQVQFIGRFDGCSGMGGGIYLRAERQWTQIGQNEHSLDRVLVGIHLGVIKSEWE